MTSGQYLTREGLGSTAALTDSTGGIQQIYIYDPFGFTTTSGGSTNSYQYIGRETDATGLYYLLARYYDSRTGTFCSADPLAGDPSDPQSWNRYPYGRNDPIDMTDPSGKSWWSSLLIDIGIGVASYFLGPELEGLFSGADASATGYAAGALPETFSYTPQLLTPGAASAASAGAGDAAAASSGGLSWALAGAGAAAAAQATDQPKKPARPSKLCNNVNAVNFVKSHEADAASVAAGLHVPTQNVLGLSAHESQWGVGRFAEQENAFFSEEGPSQPALSNGVMHPTGNPSINVWGFPSYLASARAFAARYGKFVNGMTNPSQFAGNLQKAGFNSGTRAGNGTPGWSGQVARDIANTATRMNCP